MSKKIYTSKSNFTVVIKKSTKVFEGGEWSKVAPVKLLFSGQVCEVNDEFAQGHGYKDAQDLHDKLIVKQPGYGIDYKEVPVDAASVAALEASLKKTGPTVVTEAKAIGK